MNDAIFAPFKPADPPAVEKTDKPKRRGLKAAKPDSAPKPAEKPARKPRAKKPATSSPMLKISLADMAVLSAALRPDDYEPFGAIYERLLALLAIQKAFAT